MDLSFKNYLEAARGHYTSQFSDSTNFDKLIQSYLVSLSTLQKVIIAEQTITSIDESFGAQLDILGDIVGQPRTLVGLETSGFFGFKSDASALDFGSTHNDGGGFFYSLKDTESGVAHLRDDFYRNFIKVKIISNFSGSTPEDVITATKILFQTDDVIYNEVGLANIELTLKGRSWNDPNKTNFPGFDETVIANKYLPKPLGVSITYKN